MNLHFSFLPKDRDAGQVVATLKRRAAGDGAILILEPGADRLELVFFETPEDAARHAPSRHPVI